MPVRAPKKMQFLIPRRTNDNSKSQHVVIPVFHKMDEFHVFECLKQVHIRQRSSSTTCHFIAGLRMLLNSELWVRTLIESKFDERYRCNCPLAPLSSWCLLLCEKEQDVSLQSGIKGEINVFLSEDVVQQKGSDTTNDGVSEMGDVFMQTLALFVKSQQRSDWYTTMLFFIQQVLACPHHSHFPVLSCGIRRTITMQCRNCNHMPTLVTAEHDCIWRVSLVDRALVDGATAYNLQDLLDPTINVTRQKRCTHKCLSCHIHGETADKACKAYYNQWEDAYVMPNRKLRAMNAGLLKIECILTPGLTFLKRHKHTLIQFHSDDKKNSMDVAHQHLDVSPIVRWNAFLNATRHAPLEPRENGTDISTMAEWIINQPQNDANKKLYPHPSLTDRPRRQCTLRTPPQAVEMTTFTEGDMEVINVYAEALQTHLTELTAMKTELAQLRDREANDRVKFDSQTLKEGPNCSSILKQDHTTQEQRSALSDVVMFDLDRTRSANEEVQPLNKTDVICPLQLCIPCIDDKNSISTHLFRLVAILYHRDECHFKTELFQYTNDGYWYSILADSIMSTKPTLRDSFEHDVATIGLLKNYSGYLCRGFLYERIAALPRCSTSNEMCVQDAVKCKRCNKHVISL
jgi:hypothetical protein